MNDHEKPPHHTPVSKNEGSIGKGIGIGLIIYAVMFILGLKIGFGTFMLLFGPVLHLLAIIFFFAKKQKYTGIGLLILAGIVILLISACFGIIFTQFNG